MISDYSFDQFAVVEMWELLVDKLIQQDCHGWHFTDGFIPADFSQVSWWAKEPENVPKQTASALVVLGNDADFCKMDNIYRHQFTMQNPPPRYLIIDPSIQEQGAGALLYVLTPPDDYQIECDNPPVQNSTAPVGAYSLRSTVKNLDQKPVAAFTCGKCLFPAKSLQEDNVFEDMRSLAEITNSLLIAGAPLRTFAKKYVASTYNELVLPRSDVNDSAILAGFQHPAAVFFDTHELGEIRGHAVIVELAACGLLSTT